MRPTTPSQINMIQLLYRPPCPECGGLTSLVGIEPASDPDHDLRTFECEPCSYFEVVKMRKSSR